MRALFSRVHYYSPTLKLSPEKLPYETPNSENRKYRNVGKRSDRARRACGKLSKVTPVGQASALFAYDSPKTKSMGILVSALFAYDSPKTKSMGILVSAVTVLEERDGSSQMSHRWGVRVCADNNSITARGFLGDHAD